MNTFSKSILQYGNATLLAVLIVFVFVVGNEGYAEDGIKLVFESGRSFEELVGKKELKWDHVSSTFLERDLFRDRGFEGRLRVSFERSVVEVQFIPREPKSYMRSLLDSSKQIPGAKLLEFSSPNLSVFVTEVGRDGPTFHWIRGEDRHIVESAGAIELPIILTKDFESGLSRDETLKRAHANGVKVREVETAQVRSLDNQQRVVVVLEAPNYLHFGCEGTLRMFFFDDQLFGIEFRPVAWREYAKRASIGLDNYAHGGALRFWTNGRREKRPSAMWVASRLLTFTDPKFTGPKPFQLVKCPDAEACEVPGVQGDFRRHIW